MLEPGVGPFGGEKDHAGAVKGVGAEKFGEAQVVTDGEAHFAPGGLDEGKAVAAGQVFLFIHEAEEVDLAVFAEGGAVGVE